MSFVHLRLHTEFSLVDSTIRIKQLIPAVEEGGMPAVAMTDQNNMFALVKFYRAALAQGIKPITGMDVLLINEDDPTQSFHLILLCQNDLGYRNLTKLVSEAYLTGQNLGIPRVTYEDLEKFNEGLIALSGGKDGDVASSIFSGNIEGAEEKLKRWQTIFPNRFYIELQRSARNQESLYNTEAVQLATKFNLPVVATNDVRFLSEVDFSAHEARVCINQGYVLGDASRPKNYSNQQYLKTADEMKALFEDIPEAIENTLEIAKRCNVTLTLGKNYLPKFPTRDNMSEDDFLRDESEKGLEVRLGQLFDITAEDFVDIRKKYDERLKFELGVINSMGFPGYFLIVADFIKWSKQNDIPVGPGRGSGAGSLVAYALEITDLDPLKYELLFERFLNPERISMPDFDIDFCKDKRDLVIDYVAETYGREKVSQIITYGTMAAKAVVRDVGRVLDQPYGFVDRVAKLIPFEIKMTLDKALKESPDLKELYDTNEDVKRLIDLAKKLEGLTRNVGKHAGGVLISPSRLVDFTPLYCDSSGENIVSQFDKDDVEAVGLVKFDFLGLRNLTIIDHAVQFINHSRQLKNEDDIDINAIPLDDAATFSLLKSGKTTAIFQLESRGMKDLIVRLQPDLFEEIIALVALYRPGPLNSGMTDDYVKRKHGLAKIVYDHPLQEKLLEGTYGVVVYQEQVMQIAQVLANYSLGGADILRKAMGKKKPEEMAKQRAIFLAGSEENDIDAKLANLIFDKMETFAEYGFNKSHSAAYALVSYQTAWLKTHYPAEFMASVLSSDMDSTDKVVSFLDDCQQINLEVIPPDINRSNYFFTPANGTQVIFGLGAIKGVGESAISTIVEERELSGEFTSLTDLCQRVKSAKLTTRVLETLIKGGALDSIGENRRSLIEALPSVMQMATQQHADEEKGQSDLFGVSESFQADEKVVKTYEEWPEKERLRYEKEVLGLYLTGHPINRYSAELKSLVSRSLLSLVEDDGREKYKKHPITISGIVSAIRIQNTESGKRAFVTLDDKTAFYEVFLFPKVYEQYENVLLQKELIVLEGSLNSDYETGSLRLRVEKIFDINTVRENYLRRVVLTLNQKYANENLLAFLQGTLHIDAPKSCPVFIKYINQLATAELRLADNISAPLNDETIKKLKEYLGHDAVQLEY